MRARDNPYRTERQEALAFRFPAGDWSRLWGRLEALSWRASVVGPHGSGKTTLMEQLAARLRQAGLRTRELRLRAGEASESRRRVVRWSQGVGEDEILLLDGVDELGPWARRSLRRHADRAAGLIVSAHRPGFLPTAFETTTSPALLSGLMAVLHPERSCRQPTSDELFRRHRGNLRDALGELYDWHARIGGAGCEESTGPNDAIPRV